MRTIVINNPGPQGSTGPQGVAGPSGSTQPFNNVSGSIWATTSSLQVSGSFLVSGSSTFTNIGPAIFSGSATITGATTMSSAIVSGDVTVLGTASINVLQINTTINSTGSNTLGDNANDTQTLYGSVIIPTGSLTVSGNQTNVILFTSSSLTENGLFLVNTTDPSTFNANSSPTIVLEGRQKGGGLGLLTKARLGFIPAPSATVGGEFRVDIWNGTVYSNIFAVNSNGTFTLPADTNSQITYIGSATNTIVGPARHRFTTGGPLGGSSGANTSLVGIVNSYIQSSTTNSEALLRVFPTINQTGTGTGIFRGVQVDPTITAITATGSWRSIEWTNNAGWGLYGSGSSPNYLNGNTLIGTTTDAGYKLDVNGTARFKGASNVGTTTALTVINSDSTTLLQVQDNGYIRVGSQGTSAFRIYSTDASGDAELSGLNLVLNSRVVSSATAAGIGMVMVNGINGTITTGNQNVFLISKGFAPTSGTGTYAASLITPTINQTGGANGITRGLHINPTLTAAADFRAIEVTAGKVCLNTTSGNTMIGTTTDAGFKLDVNGTARVSGLTRSTDVFVVGGTATTNTANARFWSGGGQAVTSGLYRGFYTDIAWIPTSGSAEWYGLDLRPIINQTGTANGITRGLYIAPTLTAAADFRAIETTSGSVSFNHGSTPLIFASTNGNVGIGTGSAAAYKFQVRNGDIALDFNRFLRGGFDNNWSTINLYNGSTGDMEISLFNQSWYLRHNANATFAGNVGVGLTGSISPRLQVRGSGTTSATTALRVENTNTSASLVVLDNGYVGINTGSAQYNLDVNGTTRMQGNVDIKSVSAPTIVTLGGFNELPEVRFINSNSKISLNSSNTLNFAVNWGAITKHMSIFGTSGLSNTSTTGSVSGLDLNISFSPTSGTAIFTEFLINPTINQTGGANGITRGLFIDPTLTSAANFRAIETTSGSISFNHGSTSLLFVSSSGNVGISTTTPSHRLHVVGATRLGNLLLGSAGNNAIGNTNNDTSINITNGVGIGGGSLVTPSAQLHVKGSGATSATTAFRVENTNASASLVVLDNGYTGIGIATPSSSLHIKGATNSASSSSLLVRNSSNTLLFQVLDNGQVYIPEITYVNNIQGFSTDRLQTARLISGNPVGAMQASAQLEIVSTTTGFLPPRMTNAQRTAISTPAVGLMVYCTDATEGLYIYKSTGWTFIV